MDTVELTIPAAWLPDEALTIDELHEVVTLGLIAFRSQQERRAARERVEQALKDSGRIQHLFTSFVAIGNDAGARQEPPVLDGQSVSELLIAQR